MVSNKHPFLFACLLLFCLPGAIAQSGVYYEDTEPNLTSMCVEDNVMLREWPGEQARSLARVYFTEQVSHLGRAAFVRRENQNYLWVRTSDNAEGWIKETALIKGGGSVVLLADAPVYFKLNTPQSVTGKIFRAGEIAILSDFRDNWVKLTGKGGLKEGWIQGYDALSVEEVDLEAASLFTEALDIVDMDRRRSRLQSIRDGRSYLSPEMRDIVDRAIQDTYRGDSFASGGGNVSFPDDDPFFSPDGEDTFSEYDPNVGPPSNNPQPGYNPGYVPPRGNTNPNYNPNYPPAYNNPGNNTPYNPNYSEREVVDMQTGASYLRVTERGSIQPVKAKNPPSIYYAYHKTLPKGAKVLLEVPGTGSFVQLEVIAKLKSTNKNMIGLGQEVIKAVYGVTTAKEAPAAVISYPKP
ncbi:MAG: hypothetical protein AAFR61_16215 [Bacteroidota bacterium]